MTTPESRRPTLLENVIAMTLMLAAVSFFAHIHEIGKEVFAHLGKGAAGWGTYIAFMTSGAVISIAGFSQLVPRLKGPKPRPAWGEILVPFLIVSMVGVFGYTFADSLEGEVRLKISAGHWWTVQLGNWTDLQGAIGWAIATFTFVGVWAALAQVAESWRAVGQK
ncbi:MAG TPA: hypothetical protein VF278_16015 [Pirellulales bacterium]